MSWVIITYSWTREHLAPENLIGALDRHVAGLGAPRTGWKPAGPQALLYLVDPIEDSPCESVFLSPTTALHVPSRDLPELLIQLQRPAERVGGIDVVRVFGLWRILCLLPDEAHRVRMELEGKRGEAEARYATYVTERERLLEAEIEARRHELPAPKPKRAKKKKAV